MRYKHFLINESESLFISELLRRDHSYLIFTPNSFPQNEGFDILNEISFAKKETTLEYTNIFESKLEFEKKDIIVANLIFLNQKTIINDDVLSRNICKKLIASYCINEEFGHELDLFLRLNLAFENLANSFIFNNKFVDLEIFTSTILYYEDHDKKLDNSKTKKDNSILKEINLSIRIVEEYDEFQIII